MARHQSTTQRVLSSLLIAAALALLVVGLFWFLSPRGSDDPTKTAEPEVVADVTPSPDLQPEASAIAAADPTRRPATPAVAPAQPTTDPTASPTRDVALARFDVLATRVVVPSMDIDLPIVSRDRRVANQGPDLYPPCDVAVYHTAFEQPGRPGTTYLYGHARKGMFLPLLDASERRNGRSLLGDLVQVYTNENLMYVYEITKVNRHATDFALVFDAPPDREQLILQTSEGPQGTVPKLQVLALKIEVVVVTRREAQPRPRPRGCFGE